MLGHSLFGPVLKAGSNPLIYNAKTFMGLCGQFKCGNKHHGRASRIWRKTSRIWRKTSRISRKNPLRQEVDFGGTVTARLRLLHRV
jgi:hypothetical protein